MSAHRCPHCSGEITIVAAQTPTSRALQTALRREPLFAIVTAACVEFGAPVEALLTGSRASHVTRARMIAAVILRDDHHLSYPSIGRLMECDHTTAMDACRRYGRHVAKDPTLATRADRVRARVPQETEVHDAAE